MADITLNRLRAGDGAPPIVFVHGFLCRLQDWRHQLTHFAEGHTVVACDLRGHGESPRGEAPMTIETVGGDVARMLGEEDLTGAILIGHSMGCRVVMEAWRQAKHRVAGLVLVDGSQVGIDKAAGQASWDLAIAEKGYKAVVLSLFEDMFFGAPPSWKDEAIGKVLSIPEATGAPLFGALIGWDAELLTPTMTTLDIPVLVLQSTTMRLDRVRRVLAEGEEGPFQELILKSVAGAESQTISGPGHFSMTAAPDATNARIARFIAERF